MKKIFLTFAKSPLPRSRMNMRACWGVEVGGLPGSLERPPSLRAGHWPLLCAHCVCAGVGRWVLESLRNGVHYRLSTKALALQLMFSLEDTIRICSLDNEEYKQWYNLGQNFGNLESDLWDETAQACRTKHSTHLSGDLTPESPSSTLGIFCHLWNGITAGP